MSANTTEVQGLTKVCAMLTKLSGAENTIVGMVLLDGDTNIGCLRFEDNFATDGIAGSGGQLMMDEKKCAAMVNIDRDACVAIA
jgi:hypothetical protein